MSLVAGRHEHLMLQDGLSTAHDVARGMVAIWVLMWPELLDHDLSKAVWAKLEDHISALGFPSPPPGRPSAPQNGGATPSKAQERMPVKVAVAPSSDAKNKGSKRRASVSDNPTPKKIARLDPTAPPEGAVGEPMKVWAAVKDHPDRVHHGTLWQLSGKKISYCIIRTSDNQRFGTTQWEEMIGYQSNKKWKTTTYVSEYKDWENKKARV